MKRLADIRRAEREAKLEEHHEQEIFRQKIRNLRYIEIRVMLGMGYSSQAIEQELGLSQRRIKDILRYQGKNKKDKEINYLLEVLETIQRIAVKDDLRILKIFIFISYSTLEIDQKGLQNELNLDMQEIMKELFTGLM